MPYFTFYICVAIVLAVNANQFVYRSHTEVSKESIIKTLMGVSEQQCLHRCRRDPQCTYSAYERNVDGIGASQCLLLKSDAKSFIDNNMLPIRMHTGAVQKGILLLNLYTPYVCENL